MNKIYFIIKIIFTSLVIIFPFVVQSGIFKQELLKNIELLYPSEIFFEQRQNNKSSYSEGWMIIGGKGLARTEFSPPNNLIIVANGKWLIMYDAQYNRTSYFPLNYGLFNAKLNWCKFLFGNKVLN